MTNHLTEKQIIAFKEKGFIQLDSFLPEDLCSNLRVEVDELVCKRKKQEAPLVISYHEMGMLTSYPPMISIIPQQEYNFLDDGFNSKINKRYIPLDKTKIANNEHLRLKRSKPFLASKNTLEKCMKLTCKQ